MARRPTSRPAPAADGVVPPLAGFAVALAVERRRHELSGVLEEAGAKTALVQALRVVPQPDRTALREATRRSLDGPIDELVISSPLGFRAWVVAASELRLGKRLSARLAQARLLARNAAAADSMREIGLREIWSTAAASTEELLRYLLVYPPVGGRVVVEVNSPTLLELCDALRDLGVDVVEVPTYQCSPPPHAESLVRLVDQVIRRQFDGLVLTTPAATGHVLAAASRQRRRGELLNALCDDVQAICLGRRTAAPLRALGVDPVLGPTGYLEDFAPAVTSAVRACAIQLSNATPRIEVRRVGVMVGDRYIPVQPGPLALLRVLARRPGRVVSPAEIRREVPNWSDVDDHAIEMAVFRLRRHLDGLDLVQVVMRRGYRVAVPVK